MNTSRGVSRMSSFLSARPWYIYIEGDTQDIDQIGWFAGCAISLWGYCAQYMEPKDEYKLYGEKGKGNIFTLNS